MDKQMRDRFTKPIMHWEEKHPNDPDIKEFLDEMVNLAISETLVTNLGWENHDCNVYYESKPLIDPVTREITMTVPKEKAAWMLGLVALSWLTKIVQGKIDVGHCWTHKKQTGKPCELGKKFHAKIGKEIAQNLRKTADILENMDDLAE